MAKSVIYRVGSIESSYIVHPTFFLRFKVIIKSFLEEILLLCSTLLLHYLPCIQIIGVRGVLRRHTTSEEIKYYEKQRDDLLRRR